MLIFFILCALLRTLQGASIPPPSGAFDSAAATNLSVIMGRESPAVLADGAQPHRTIYSIVQSCLLTIFACVWTSAHPDINGPRDSGWTCMKRRLVTMLWTVIAPELVLFWAVRQHVGAESIAKEYNKKFFPESGNTERSIWDKVVGWFQLLPKPSTRRGDRQSWTIVHGFFVQMGGFMLYDDEYPKEVLDYDRLVQLLEHNVIDAPTVTERGLQDHSKGDTISKGIVVLQTMWFGIQCIARAPQHLPLSELEVLTLAFVVTNVAIYVVWWNKPQGVDMAVCVPLKSGTLEAYSWPSTSEEPYEPENISGSGHASLPQSDRHSNDKLPLIPPPDPEQHPNQHVEETRSWFWRGVQKDHQHYSLFHFILIRLPYRLFGPVLQIGNKLVVTEDRKKETLTRMPMFYALDPEKYEDRDSHRSSLRLLCFITGLLFGAVHLIAWGSEFPSPHDLVLWRISAILATVEPFLVLVLMPLMALRDMNENVGAVANKIALGPLALVVLLIPFYIAARFAVIIIAFKAIVHPPPGVLLGVSWTSYIPHL